MKQKQLRQWTLWVILFMGLIGVVFIAWLATVPALPTQFVAKLPQPLRTLWLPDIPTALPAPTLITTYAPLTLPPLPTLIPTFTPKSNQLNVTITPAPAPSATAIPTATPLPSQHFISGLTIIPQTFNNCSPANLTMVLNFYGQNLSQEKVATTLKPNANDRNVSPEEMAAYVQSSNQLGATVFYGADFDFLRRLLAADFPVITEQGYDPADDEWMGHYLTLVGYDDLAQSFWAMDSLLGPWDSRGRQEPYATVQQNWWQFNNVAIVVYPLEQEQKVLEIAGTTLSSPLTMWQQSAQTAQIYTQTNANDSFAWFNLGKSLTHLYLLTNEADYYEAAAAAFDQARAIGLPYRLLWYQFELYQAYLAAQRYQDVHSLVNATLSTIGGQNVEETYLYQGHAFLQQGDRLAAQNAYQTALQLNPAFAAAQTALAQLNQ